MNKLTRLVSFLDLSTAVVLLSELLSISYHTVANFLNGAAIDITDVFIVFTFWNWSNLSFLRFLLLIRLLLYFCNIIVICYKVYRMYNRQHNIGSFLFIGNLLYVLLTSMFFFAYLQIMIHN